MFIVRRDLDEILTKTQKDQLFDTKFVIKSSFPINPFSTAVPIWGQPSLIQKDLSPKRDWGLKGLRRKLVKT